MALLLVVLTGAMNAVQSGANAQLVRSTGRPLLMSVLVSLVTTGAFAVAWGLDGFRLPEAGRLAAAPWWAWTGGLLGAAYVASTLFFAGPLGAGVFTGVTITAGLAASVVVDHFGWVGFAPHALTPGRVLGVLVMVAGLLLVVRS